MEQYWKSKMTSILHKGHSSVTVKNRSALKMADCSQVSLLFCRVQISHMKRIKFYLHSYLLYTYTPINIDIQKTTVSYKNSSWCQHTARHLFLLVSIDTSVCTEIENGKKTKPALQLDLVLCSPLKSSNTFYHAQGCSYQEYLKCTLQLR